MQNVKKYLALFLTLLFLFALASCGDNGEANGSDNGGTASDEGGTASDEGGTASDEGGSSDGAVIKIGHVCDQTGTDALTGAEAKDAMNYAVEYVQKYYGYNGYTIEVVHGDSQSTADGAADAARKLIEDDGVVAVFGPTMIGQKAAVANVCAEHSTPLIFYNPTPEGLYAGNEWVVGASGTTPQMPTVMADYIYNELGYHSVYLLTKDDTGGTAYSEPFIQLFEDLGGTVVLDQYANNETTTDYSPYLLNMKASEADCLVAWTSGSAAIQLWKDWYDNGLADENGGNYLPIVAMFSGAFTDSFICDALNASGRSDVVEKMLGTLTPMSYAYNLTSEENEQFVAAYQEDHNGSYPIGNNLSGACAQVIMLFRAAVESLGGDVSDSEALRTALLAQDIQGPEGRTVFENGSQAATKDIFVVEIVQLPDGAYNYGIVKEYAAVSPDGLTAN